MARYFGAGVESTYGTAVAPTDFSEIVSESMAKTMTFEDIQAQQSLSIQNVVPLTSMVGGEVEILGNYSSPGLLMKHFFGAATTAGSYTHTFPGTVAGVGRVGKSLTLEIERDDAAIPDGTMTWTYAGCKVVGMTFSASRDQSPRFTFSFLGKSETNANSTGYTAPASQDLMLITDMTVGYDGTDLDMTDFSLRATWPVDEPFVIGSQVFSSEPRDNGPMLVEWDANVILNAAAVSNYADFGSTTAVDVIPVVTADAGSSLTFNMPKTRITQMSTNLSGRETIMAAMSGRTYFNTATTQGLEAILINDDVSIP